MKKYLISILLLFSSTPSFCWGLNFDEMERQIENHMKQMQKMFKETNKQFKESSQNSPIAITQEKNAIIVILSSIESNNIEARLNDINNLLTITFPHKKLVLQAAKNIIAIELQESTQSDKEKKDENSEKTMAFIGTSISQLQKTVNGTPLLEKQTITYDETNHALKITIPLEQKDGKIIPINTVNHSNILQE